MNKLYILIFSLILLLGISLRAVEVLNKNYLFGHDHGRDFLIAKNMIENHKITLIGSEAGSGSAGLNGLFQGPGYYYELALAYWIFKGDPYGALVETFLIGVLVLIGGFLLARKTHGKFAALIILFFYSISPLIVSESRFFWSNHSSPIFIIPSLFFLYKLKENQVRNAFLTVLFAALTYHFQLAVAVPMLLAIILSFVLIYRITDWKVYLVSILAVLIGFSPMIIFETRHNFLGLRGLLTYLQSNNSHTFVFPLTRISQHFPSYWFNFINTFTIEFMIVPLPVQRFLVGIFLPFVIYASVLTGERKMKLFNWSLLLMVLVTFGFFLFLNNVVWDYYLIHLRFAYIYLYAYAINYYIQQKSREPLYIATYISICCMFLSLTISAFNRVYNNYSIDYHDYGKYYKIAGKRAAVEYMYEDAKKSPFNAIIFVPYIYTYPYDYLFQTYGKQKYGYIPGKNKKGLVYLLIEPDTDQPWRQKGWLETVVQGGIVLDERTLPSGQILIKKQYD